MAAIASWRCYRCNEVTRIKKGSEDFTFKRIAGHQRPVHRNGCPTERGPRTVARGIVIRRK